MEIIHIRLSEEIREQERRGAAERMKEEAYETPIQTKALLNVEKKDQIAAASLVNEGDVIYIDSGTTVYESRSPPLQDL